MDHGGLSEGSWTLEEGGMPRSHLQPTTSRRRLGSSSLLWHSVHREKCSAEEDDGQRAFWTSTPLLKDNMHMNVSVEIMLSISIHLCGATGVEVQLAELDPLEWTVYVYLRGKGPWRKVAQPEPIPSGEIP